MNQVKAIVIRDDQKRLKDWGDVIKIARALGQQAFKTRENVLVKKIWHDPEYGYIVIVEGPQSCTEPLGVRGGGTAERNG